MSIVLLRGAGLVFAFSFALAASCTFAQQTSPYVVAGDAIAQPLTQRAGDAAAGREIVASRTQGLCLLCHSAPLEPAHLQGNLAPSLSGVGARLSAAQIRLRLVEPQRLNPDTIMPSYLRTSGLQQLGAAWVGKPLLSAQQIEDVVAYLVSLKP